MIGKSLHSVRSVHPGGSCGGGGGGRSPEGSGLSVLRKNGAASATLNKGLVAIMLLAACIGPFTVIETKTLEHQT